MLANERPSAVTVGQEPRFSGPQRSGRCKCGHTWGEHHLGVVMNKEYFEKTGESYFPQECEYFGCNENGGFDADGNPHCDWYVDEKEAP